MSVAHWSQVATHLPDVGSHVRVASCSFGVVTRHLPAHVSGKPWLLHTFCFSSAFKTSLHEGSVGGIGGGGGAVYSAHLIEVNCVPGDSLS